MGKAEEVEEVEEVEEEEEEVLPKISTHFLLFLGHSDHFLS